MNCIKKASIINIDYESVFVSYLHSKFETTQW